MRMQNRFWISMKRCMENNSLSLGLSTSRALRLIRRSVTECLRKEKNRKEFEEWYLKEYGKPYVWKFKNH